MADNITLNAGSGGDVLRADDLGSSVKTQCVKIITGAAGAEDGIVDNAFPLPVRLSDGTETVNVNTSNQLEVEIKNSSLTVAQGTHDNLCANANVQVANTDAGANNPVPVQLYDGTGNSCMDVTNDALRVNIVAGGGSGGTAMADDAAFTVGGTNMTPVGGLYKSSPDSVDDGDVGALGMTATRALRCTIETPDGDSAIDEATNSVKVYIVGGSESGAMTDDAAFTPGTTSVTPVAGTYRSTRDAIDDNDAGAIAITAKRGVLCVLETPNGDSVLDDTNDCVKASVTQSLPAGTNNIGDVDVLTCALPTGAATESTLGDIKTATETVAAAVSTEMQCDIVTHPADTFVAEAGALGKGVLCQADDGTDRHNMQCDASGRLYIDVARYAGITPQIDNFDTPAVSLWAKNAAAGDTAVLVDAAGNLQVDVLSSALPSGAATESSLATVAGAVSGSEMQVDVVTSALPSGAATESSLATVAAAVSGSEMQVDVVTSALPSGAATETTLAAIQTAVEAIDNPVSGSEMLIAGGPTQTNDVKVTLDSEAVVLGAGAASIGTLGANSGVDIGDVDITSVVPGTGATNLGKAEDAAFAGGDTGVMVMAVRQDDISTGPMVDTNGDYHPLQTDEMGLLRVIPGLQSAPNYVTIDESTSGDHTLVAAQGGSKKIRVLSMLLIAAGDVTVTIETSTDTAISGPYTFDGATQPKGVNLDFSPVGHFVTDANELLNMNLSAAIRVAGHLVYDIIQ